MTHRKTITITLKRLQELDTEAKQALLAGKDLTLDPFELMALLKIIQHRPNVNFAAGESVEFPFELEVGN